MAQACTELSELYNPATKRTGRHNGVGRKQQGVQEMNRTCITILCAGIIALTAFISPYRIDRDRVRNNLGDGEFIEVFVDTPIEVCESRDPKGLYVKARAGLIKGFTGIDDPYEAPESPEITLSAADKTPDQLADEVIAYLEQRRICTVSQPERASQVG